MHPRKPEIFSGFLRFSPDFSFSQKSKNSQNKKISFAKNDWSEGETTDLPFISVFEELFSTFLRQ